MAFETVGGEDVGAQPPAVAHAALLLHSGFVLVT